MKRLPILIFAFAAVSATAVEAAGTPETPAILNGYVASVGAKCHRPEKGDALLATVAQRADLDGDGIDDWIIDVGRVCPAPTGPAAAFGSQVTVFRGTAQGNAFPAFQQAALGSRLERTAGKTRLILTLPGVSCGAPASTAPCDRVLKWNAQASRFDLQPIGSTPAKPASQGETKSSR